MATEQCNSPELQAPPPPVISIKQEKIDPEIEEKIKELSTKSDSKDQEQQNSNDESQTSDEDEEEDHENESDSESSQNQEDDEEDGEAEDEKKAIEPVKSSNEILMELFNVFNAAPPEELLDDKNLIEKTRKRKKEKKKKHKRNKSEGECSGAENELGSSGKHKKKKKHKHKHKEGDKSKEKKKSKDRSKDKEKSKEKKKSKEREKKNGAEASKERDEFRYINIKLEKDSTRKVSSAAKSGSSTEHKRHHEKESYADDGRKRRKLEERSTKSQSNPFYSTTYDDRDIKKEPHDDKDKYCKNGGKIAIKIKKDFRENSSRKISDGEISEISLSDEESYLRGKEKQSDYGKYKSRNSFYANTERSHSREGDRQHNKDRYHGGHENEREREDSHHHQRNRGASGRGYHSRRSRSRSGSRSRDLGIDKKRLLEIARKNAITMFKRGNLPGCANMTEDVKDRVLLKMRYGGRTVEDLTEFCKKISNGEHLSDLSSDEGSDIDKSGNAKAFHHPFQLKEREPIVMHIRNSKPIVPAPKASEDTKTITMQFPVSSGQQHRMTEAWVPVERKDKLPPLPVLPAATQSTTIFKSTIAKNALGKPLPTEGKQEPAFKPVGETASTPAAENETMLTNIPTPAALDAPIPQPVPPPQYMFSLPLGGPPPPVPVPPPTLSLSVPQIATPMPPTPVAPTAVPNNFVPDVPVPSSMNSVFPQASANAFDVSAIISKRLNAMRRLQENPMDSEALKLMYNSQKEMSSWAASKHMPGQFTGSTGANILKPNELNSGPQVWAKKNQLTSTKPVTGGMGMHLLQKMGWRPGEGLGREKNGSLQPLLLDVKLDKRGLVAQEDLRPPKKRAQGGHGPPPPAQNLQDKHPVCLLNELTTKYKWTPPLYTLVHENGPSHSRMFLFSVQVNNETYTPTKLSNTKKEAKFLTAKLCLQQLGILPPG